MSASSYSVVSVAVVAVLAAGCSSTEPGGGGGGGGGSTLAIARANPSGDGQVAVVATALPNPLRVVVRENGAPVSGRTVSWSATSGSVTASSNTDAQGIAAAQWTLGQAAGIQSASATLSGAGGSPVSFSASATAGAAASIAKAGGDAQSGFVNFDLTDPLRALAADQFGNPVSGVSLMWSVTSGTATVNPATTSTGSNGEGQTTVTLGGTAGPIVIQALSTGLSGSPLAYSATSMVLPTAVTVQMSDASLTFSPKDITIAAGGTVTWNWETSLIIHNVVPDVTEPVTSGAPVNGPNSYQFVFSTPGVYQYYCVVHGLPGGVGMSGTVTVL